MEIPPNPASTRFSADVKNFRKDFKGKDDARKEIKAELTRRNLGKYGGKPDNDPIFDKLDTYRDLAFYADAAPVPPNRLGGVLSKQPPLIPPPPVPNTVVVWPPDAKKPEVNILTDGTIVHTDAGGNEIEVAHQYMHAIFNHILYDTRGYLERINEALEQCNEIPPTATSQDYTAAVAAFQKFAADLAPGGNSPYAKAFQFVNINPVVTNEGFIVSVRVKLRWKNPWHSSSTIRVP